MKVKNLFISLIGFACVSEAYAASQHITNNINYKNLYVSGETGISIPSFSKDDSNNEEYYKGAKPKVGIPFGAEVGYRFSNDLRVGLNISYRSHKINQDVEFDSKDKEGKDSKDKANVNQKFSSTLFMLNGKYSICDFYGVKPYVMAGIGMNYAVNGAYTKNSTANDGSVVSDKYAGQNKMKFAWNIGVGIEKELGNNFVLGLGYRFINLGKREISGEKTVLGAAGLIQKYDNITPISASLKAHEITLGITYNF